MGPNRNEWQKRCTFNGFCKKVLKNEAIDAIRENRTRSRREVTFSDLSPQEENQLYTCDQYFVNDEAEKSFFVAGREITAKQLADALHSLPEEKRQPAPLHHGRHPAVQVGRSTGHPPHRGGDRRRLGCYPGAAALRTGAAAGGCGLSGCYAGGEFVSVYDMAVVYYPRLWDKSRLEALVAAGRLTEAEMEEIINNKEA